MAVGWAGTQQDPGFKCYYPRVLALYGVLEAKTGCWNSAMQVCCLLVYPRVLTTAVTSAPATRGGSEL